MAFFLSGVLENVRALALSGRARPLLYHVVMGPVRYTTTMSAVAFALGLATAQSPASVRDGVYSDAQAVRGATLYQTACASCHGNKLQGKGPTPALVGSDFVMDWSGMTVGDLFDKMQTSMPADKPGSLSREQNASLVAYLLDANKFPSGTSELSSSAELLRQIRFEAAPAK
jgi:mono/diheme cytochrome c family protein